MGMITVSFKGSFKLGDGQYDKTFSAHTRGHANAIGEAIKWLAELLPGAIRQDHQLHESRVKPEDNFGLKE